MGVNLRQERSRLGLKQTEVAEKINVGIATYVRWEKGKPIPSDKLAELAEVGFDVNYIVTGERSYKPDFIVNTSDGQQMLIEAKNLKKDLLSDCIAKLEQALELYDASLEPEIKAKVIFVLYEEALETNQPVNEETVNRSIRLVA